MSSINTLKTETSTTGEMPGEINFVIKTAIQYIYIYNIFLNAIKVGVRYNNYISI